MQPPPAYSTRLSSQASAEKIMSRSGVALPARIAGVLPSRSANTPWPEDLLISFSLRMASHGMSICRIEMLGDTQYALQQLSHARGMGDSDLIRLVDELYRWFAEHQATVHAVSH